MPKHSIYPPMEPFEVERRWDGPLTPEARALGRAIAQLDHLPSLPEVLIQILEVIADESVSMDEVVRRLELDPGLCSKILKRVNSAFYGFPRRISSLQRAVVLLGFNTIKQVALGATVMDLFDHRTTDGFQPHRIWRHSVFTGTYATLVGACMGLSDRDSLFVAGLLHDIGKFLFREVAPEAYAEVLQSTDAERGRSIEVERARFGLDHAEAGALLARAWEFPERLVVLIRNHHIPPGAGRVRGDLEVESHVIYAANLLAHNHLRNSGGGPVDGEDDWRVLQDMLLYWRITPTELNQMESEVQRRAEGALEALDVHGM